jgi:uracil phosphoribosyltransferase
MRHLVVQHPLIAHKLASLRARETDSPTFRRLTDELVSLLAYEATRSLPLVDVTLDTPVQQTRGQQLEGPSPLVVPVLRSGLGMLDGMLRMLPDAEVGFLGIVRDESTLQASTYATRMPADLAERQVFVLDPMLATGGTLSSAVSLLLERGAAQVTAICLIAAPEGVARVEADHPHASLTLVTAALDERLNDVGYIVPGLGDAGDRLYGEAAG